MIGLGRILPRWLLPWWSHAPDAAPGWRCFDEAGNETTDPKKLLELMQREHGLTGHLQIFDSNGAIVAESGNRSEQAEQPQPYGQ